MELSSFSENIVTETFERSGESVELKINRDAMLPNFSEVLAERLAPTTQRLQALMLDHAKLESEIEALQRTQTTKKGRPKKQEDVVDISALAERLNTIRKGIADVKREMYAEQLTCPVLLPDGSVTCILKGWDITENSQPISASKENLLRLPTAAVETLFEFVMSKMETVKKKVESETRETSETMQDGSPGLRVVGQTG